VSAHIPSSIRRRKKRASSALAPPSRGLWQHVARGGERASAAGGRCRPVDWRHGVEQRGAWEQLDARGG
jgi:hypothetical protein